MKYIRLKTTDPYYNLAVEEFLLRHTKDDYFMLWQNRPSVIVGKNQNVYAEVCLEAAERRGVLPVRRITGGGAVYHDGGNINYTFITSENQNIKPLDFEYFARPVMDALASLGLDCALSGRNDIECGGRKISGNARYSSDGRILHHGTLLFSADTDIMSEVLRTDKEKLEFKAVRSHKGRVVNISSLLPGLTAEDFILHIEKEVLRLTDSVPCTPPDDERIARLAERNGSKEWIFSERRYLTAYSLQRRKKFPFGVVCADMELAGEVIESIRISGDFFGDAPISELEAALEGLSLSEVASVSPEPYIRGMTKEEFSALLRG